MRLLLSLGTAGCLLLAGRTGSPPPVCPPPGGRPDPAGGLSFDSTDVDRDAVLSPDTPPFHPPNRTGRVIARFVIDTTGRADLRTLDIEDDADTVLAAAVRQFMPLARFIPAQLEGCRVRVWARWPFTARDRRQGAEA